MLRPNQEEDLRWYFARGLESDAGARSTIGAMLDRLMWKLPPSNGARDPYDDHDGLVRAVQRDRMVRLTLGRVEAWQAHALRVAYGEIPRGKVWGLVDALGSREGAALAVSLCHVAAPGGSQWADVHGLVTRAKNGSDKAKKELAELRAFVARALTQSRAAYSHAEVALRREGRSRRAEFLDRVWLEQQQREVA